MSFVLFPYFCMSVSRVVNFHSRCRKRTEVFEMGTLPKQRSSIIIKIYHYFDSAVICFDISYNHESMNRFLVSSDNPLQRQ